MELDYFAPEEFRNCIPKCEKEQMDKRFLERLNRARRIAGLPFVPFHISEYNSEILQEQNNQVP